MSGDLRRATAVILAGAARVRECTVAGAGDPAEVIASAVTAELNVRAVGDQRATVVSSVLDAVTTILSGLVLDASHELARLTGLPPAAARTKAGWKSALAREDVEWPADDRLETMPGTPVVNQIALTSGMLTQLDHLERYGHDELDSIWASTARFGSFDDTVAELSARHDWVGDLGWAMIRFESLKHVSLVWHQANKLERSFADREAADMVGWGWLGLRTALRHYDPELGFTFSTYACTRIIGAIRDGVRAESPVPKRLNTFSRKVAAVEADLTQALGRVPTSEEVATTVGAELRSLELVRRTAPQASIDEIAALLSERGTTPGWMVADADVEGEALALTVRDAIDDALSLLPADEATAVRLLVMEGLTPTEARIATGATARALRQRKERGLAALREALGEWSPEFLDAQD